MNDRYLFRAKRIDNRECVEGCLLVLDDETYRIAASCLQGNEEHLLQVCAYEVDPSTICQCTGLKDKNGKLIWENDVVDFLGHKGIVKYECGSFGISYRECIDWEEIEANICHITGCDNALYACENDNFISLWEIYWNFNDEDDSVNTVEIISNIFDEGSENIGKGAEEN